MAMTPQKELLLAKLNDAAVNAHQAASARAQSLGRQPLPAPVPLSASDIEYPVWLHKGWKATKKPGHFEPEESELAKSPEEAKELAAKGYTEAPPAAKADAKK